MLWPTPVALAASLAVGGSTLLAGAVAAQPVDGSSPPNAKAKDPAPAANATKPTADAFDRRLAALKKKIEPIQVRMAPGDDPAAVPDGALPTGPVLVAGQRLGIFTPPMLSPDDVQLVIQQNIADVRRCYKQQLRRDPSWSDRLILDLAIKRTGRVSEVDVAPRRVQRAVIGRCLMRAVPRWRFPRFTGETEDGVTHEVLNASFPFDFAPR